MRTRRTFAAEPASVPAARRLAMETLDGLSPELKQSVELMVSELSTNGVRHGQTSFELEIEWSDGEVRVAVTDSGGGTPQMRFPSPDEPSGRGLQIVDMLSDEWGVSHRGGAGKTVWFTLNTAEEDPAGHRSASSGGRITRPREPAGWTFMAQKFFAASSSPF